MAGLGSVWDVLDRPDGDFPTIVALMLSRARDIESDSKSGK